MRLLRDNGLTIVLMLLFGVSIVGQLLAGWHVELTDAARHHQPGMSLPEYAHSASFVAAVFENWESEFLQMSAYVMLTAVLFQRGSAESKDPDAVPRDDNLAAKARADGAPNILRQGHVWRALYGRSLGLALAALFLVSFVFHWIASARTAAEEAIEHGEPALSVSAYLFSSQLWFESFQNWQSEFLSTAVLVVLSIFLRQKESPESKPVAAPHTQTGA
ncbi:hypothetical protein KRR38_22245 [Novosphingobium sp. G106]|uniref:DUF6766 family protein n=1 Tax=Novosphingobium sp. G106 TaxID=2849500 RepID=UPI001C2CFFBC|nr:DUF6766 family protein [Novosphingobium sp. G106]MBV1690329.1 hypothetical protein [Novosphingobium sp. G106]